MHRYTHTHTHTHMQALDPFWVIHIVYIAALDPQLICIFLCSLLLCFPPIVLSLVRLLLFSPFSLASHQQ